MKTLIPWIICTRIRKHYTNCKAILRGWILRRAYILTSASECIMLMHGGLYKCDITIWVLWGKEEVWEHKRIAWNVITGKQNVEESERK